MYIIYILIYFSSDRSMNVTESYILICENYWSNDFSDQKFWNRKSNLFYKFSRMIDIIHEYRIRFSKDRSMNITKWPILICERNCESLSRLLLVKQFFESKNFEIGTFICSLFHENHDRYHSIEYIFREIDRWM